MSYLNLLIKSLDPSAVAWRDMCDASIPNLELTLYDAFVRQCKGCFAWNNLDWLYLGAAFDDQSSRINRFSPGTLDAVKVNSPTFTQHVGWTCGNANRLGNTQTLAQSQSSQDSACLIAAWMDNATWASGIWSTNAQPHVAISPKLISPADSTGFRCNGGNAQNNLAGTTTSKGLFAVSRRNSANFDAWRGTEKTTVTRPSAVRNELGWVIGQASGTQAPWSLVAFGAALTDAQIINVRAAYNAYMIGLGQNPL
jgi:hypothetical protein